MYSVFLSFNLYAEAVPRKIVQLMKVEDLTRTQVASHLQVLNYLSSSPLLSEQDVYYLQDYLEFVLHENKL